MGRGLSPLQKYILVAAMEKENDPHVGQDAFVLRKKDVMVGYYGFGPRTDEYSDSKQSSHEFDLSEIGEKRYRAAAVAIRKAFLRLQKRELVVVTDYYWYKFAGVELTEKGKEVAGDIDKNRKAAA